MILIVSENRLRLNMLEETNAPNAKETADER